MNKLSDIFFSIGIIILLAFLMLNLDLSSTNLETNLVFYTWEINIVLYLIIAFIAYIILIWILLKFSDIFTKWKQNKLSSEISELKAKLYDNQSDLLKSIDDSFKKEFLELDKSIKEKIDNQKNDIDEKFKTQNEDINSKFDSINEEISKISANQAYLMDNQENKNK